MRAEDLIEEIEKQYPDSVLLIENLSEKEKIEYVAIVKLIEYMKLLTKNKG